MSQGDDMTKADKLQLTPPCSFICHIYAPLMLVWRALTLFLKVEESTASGEFVVKMILMVAVSTPNDVSGATH